MRYSQPLLSTLVLAAPLSLAAAPLTSLEAEQLFVRRVQPLFQEKCIACHGKDEAKIKGGLDLRTLKSTLEGGDSLMPALVAGKPEQSPLYLASTRTHDDWEAMPPKDNDKLSAEQVAYLKDWIAAGAPWPEGHRATELLAKEDKWSASAGVAVKTSGGLDATWTNRKYKPEDLWAYQPLKKPAAPTGREGGTERGGEREENSISPSPALPLAPSSVAFAANPIDAFIAVKQRDAGITPAPAADARTFLRRATYDLIGLPPTPEEVTTFEAAYQRDADAAIRALVDRLLTSPHYGEKWGQHWLDVARYADTSGFANDFARGNAWRYRDYVVRAFNQDKPYDQFLREQIAGDEIAEARKAKDGAPITLAHSSETSESELLVATGFLRMGPWELTGMEVPKVARQKLLDDITDSVGQTFLAHPLQCARCHDHKFDPIPTKDYYSFQAVFATTQIAERAAPFLPTERTEGFEEKKYLLQREEHHKAVLKKLDEKSIAAAREWYRDNNLDPAEFEAAVKAAGAGGNAKKGASRTREVSYNGVRTALMRKGIPEEKLPPKFAGFTPEDFGNERMARKGLQRLRWEIDRYEPLAFSVYSGRTPELRDVLAPLKMPAARMTAGELEQTCILTGGDPFAFGAAVAPAVLSAASNLAGMPEELSTVPSEIGGRRLALANWIASPQNPLTPRVMVNRLWLWHFGQPLAGNPNNFGATGKKPTHPELLDWLAATFVESGWSVKAMHRLIMTSAAYRRESQHPEPKALAERDPHGTTFAVFRPRRLTAEELRDSMLAISGELNPAIGGIPARPEINPEAAMQPRQVMGTFAEAWQPNPLPAQRHRRSIYTLKVRGQLDPFMEVFNSPSPDLSCEARDASTVTPQVFSLFNSEASLDRALALAARARREAPAPEAALARAFQLATGRAPAPAESKLLLAHYTSMLARQRTLTFAKPVIPHEVVREAVEENTGEKFTFREPLEVAADFVSDLKPADAPAETRALADVCLVLLNSNEFAYIY